jgi:hypothetical protein
LKRRPAAVARTETGRREDWPGFLLTAVEFGLLVLVIRVLEIESQRFDQLMAWAWAGFVVNHFLPSRWRLPFFVALSLWCLKVVAGGTVAVCVFGAGLAFLGLCHLPVAFGLRLVLIGILGAAVACLRVGTLSERVSVAAWAILGSMFMFRIIVYLYDLKHKNAPFSLFRGMAYFFMMPNVCFMFFPLVDYKTFCSAHFNDVPVRIYQVGVRWILRGIVHLLLYRIIHQLGTVTPWDVNSLGGVVRFMVTTFLLYLKVSGQFHIIVGLLHMFGFNLSETHHLYFLSSSFTDLWRRINIYWKDFLTKIFFFPAFFGLKRLGTGTAMAISTLLTFVATWFLHGYQYFWIRGSFDYTWQNQSLAEEGSRLGRALIKAFNFSWQDSLFWAILAVLVLINALYEAKKGRRRALTKQRRTLASQIRLAVCTIGVFVILCTLWTVWYSKSLDELKWLAGAARNASLRDFALIVGGLVGLGVAAILFDRFEGNPVQAARESRMSRRSIGRSLAHVGLPACVLLLVGYQEVPSHMLATTAGDILLTLQHDELLTQEEIEDLHRGYYEELDVARRDGNLKFLRAAVPAGWCSFTAFQHDTGYFRVNQLTPHYSAIYHGKHLTINRWGLRDRDSYQKEKPAGVFRIALLGSSHEFGSGVADEEVFDNLVEDRINAESGTEGRRYEILNFAQPSDSTFQYLVELQRQAVQFSPDAILVFVNGNELKRTLVHLTEVYREGIAVPYGAVRQAFEEAGLQPGMSAELISVKLKPFTPGLIAFAFRQFADFGRQNHAPVYVVFRPSVISWSKRNAEDEVRNRDRLSQLAQEAGLPMIDLSKAFDGVKNRRSLMVNSFDDHMNAEAHRLLADCLFKHLHNPDRSLIFPARQPVAN